ncbi:hypothetical protein Tco_0680453 [Tanacetum coccineum]|uniref:Uncharacterized protein n=1 Tax=Tanacetum coccineum TaxID=301880 RepID=A0ABQ4XKK7_9ASTR
MVLVLKAHDAALDDGVSLGKRLDILLDLLAEELQQSRDPNDRPSSQSLGDGVADDAGKKTYEEPANEDERNGYANSTNRDSTVSPSISTAGKSFVNGDDLPTDPLMPNLEDTTDLLNTKLFLVVGI